jgi:hypothetical protein
MAEPGGLACQLLLVVVFKADGTGPVANNGRDAPFGLRIHKTTQLPQSNHPQLHIETKEQAGHQQG